MREVCLGTIGNFEALSVDPRPLKKEVSMKDKLCELCKVRTATYIEKELVLCSRYTFLLLLHGNRESLAIGNHWQSQGIVGNRQTQAIGNPRESAILGNRRGNAGMCRQSQGMHRGNVGMHVGECGNAEAITGNRERHRQLAMQGIRNIGNPLLRNS